MSTVTDQSPEHNPINRTELLRDPTLVAKKIQEWRAAGYHVLSPATMTFAFAAGYALNVSLVVIDSTVDPDTGMGKETYFDRGSMKAPRDPRNADSYLLNDPKAERAIGLVGLNRIAACAGVEWDPMATRRTDDRRIVNYWEFTAWGYILTLDGTRIPISGTKEVDLRDDSAQIGCWTPQKWADLMTANGKAGANDKKSWAINGWSDKRVIGARAHGARLAESKAKNAAIRSLGLNQKYTVEELAQPFVVLRAVFIPDMTDPETRRMVTAARLFGQAQLYPHQRPMLPPAAPVGYLEAPIDVSVPAVAAVAQAPVAAVAPMPPAPPPPHAGAPVPAQSAASTSAPTPASSPAPAPAAIPSAGAPARPSNGGLFVVDCRVARTGSNANGPWKKFEIKFSNGDVTGTFSESLADLACEAQAKNVPVLITTESNGKYGTALKSLTLDDGSQPPLDYDDGPDRDEPASTSTARPDLTARELGF